MAIQMTREEYQARYGVPPVLGSSSLDTTPAPIRMTQEEYDAIYRPKELTKVQQIGQTIKGAYKEGVQKSTAGFESLGKIPGEVKNIKSASDVAGLFKKTVRGELRFLGGAVDAAFAPLAPAFAPVGKYVGAVSDKVSNIPAVQKLASGTKGQERIEKTQDVIDLINIGTIIPLGKVSGQLASKAGSKVAEVTTDIVDARKTALTNKVADEILNIENNYNKTAIKNTLSKDSGAASRQRIASTDALVGIVDQDGKITIESANAAAEIYRKQTIDGAEGIVRDVLKKEGKTVNAEQVRGVLREEIASSGLQGADLVSALRGIEREIQGLKIRGDELNNIPLATIQDAKISTTKHINYDKPVQVSYRSALAKGYRKLVEDISKANIEVGGVSYGIREINERLGMYLGDIKRIRELGGKRVKGGRLGKYTSQIAGNFAGAGAGAMVGGPVGMAIGTVVGGEVASRLRGRTMASTFGKPRGLVAKQDELLNAAKLESKKASTVDLKKPDIKVGAPKSVKKTKEILKTERQISKNVDQQKLAIKKGDFTLVATLKELYASLVNKLKRLVKEGRSSTAGKKQEK